MDADAGCVTHARHLQRRDHPGVSRRTEDELQKLYWTCATKCKLTQKVNNRKRRSPTAILKQMKMFQNAGEKKENFILIPLIRRENERINGVDTEPMTMIGRPSLERWDAKVRKCVYAWFIILTGKHLKHMFISLLWKRQPAIPMSGQAYDHIIREHATVCHADNEWARDDDGDDIREVHTNTIEGMWTDVRNYLRPFKGVHKDYLSGYVAMAEFRRNLKSISPEFHCHYRHFAHNLYMSHVFSPSIANYADPRL